MYNSILKENYLLTLNEKQRGKSKVQEKEKVKFKEESKEEPDYDFNDQSFNFLINTNFKNVHISNFSNFLNYLLTF